MVASDEDPPSSAGRARSTTSALVEPGIGVGRLRHPCGATPLPYGLAGVGLPDVPGWATELLTSAKVAHLAFLDEHARPRVLPVTYAVWDGAVWSAIDRKPKRTAEPARVRRLRRRPEAALIVDVYDDDWTRLAWLELRGRVAIVPVRDAPDALAALVARYPRYTPEPPPGPLLRLAVEDATWWRAVEP
jgi:PPOX class probable F420-dependent enzyme